MCGEFWTGDVKLQVSQLLLEMWGDFPSLMSECYSDSQDTRNITGEIEL